VEEAVARELGLDVVGRLPGGEHGAWAVVDADGRPLVLKIFPSGERDRLTVAVEIAARLRQRGVPVPHPYRVGTSCSASYTLQQRCEGDVPSILRDTHARQLLALWSRHLHAVPEGSNWAAGVIRALTVGDPSFFADHVPIRAAGPEVAALLDEIVQVGQTADASLLRGTDGVHGDWHHKNLLVIADHVSTIFDWESARPGDARLDLAYLSFWTDVFDGTEVEPAAAERIRDAANQAVDPPTRRILSALVALQQLCFTTAHRPARIPEAIGHVQTHLAPWWRA